MDKYRITLEILGNSHGFDEKIFSTLAAETSEEVACSILHEFRHTLQDCSTIFAEALISSNPDIELLLKTSHRIKGSSKLLGFTNISEFAEKLRLPFKDQLSRPQWESTLQQFHDECIRVQDQLESIFQS